ncbi:MAG: hypothetical protein R3E77_07005 [Steroidobacteraceae bacterium]
MITSSSLNRKFSELADQARSVGELFRTEGRSLLGRAALRVEAANKPVLKLTDAATRLSGLSHRTVEQLLAHQAESFGQLTAATARRLASAAKSRDLRHFYTDQVATLPASGKRIRANALQAVGIVADAGREARQILLPNRPVKVARGKSRPARKSAAGKRAARRSNRSA